MTRKVLHSFRWKVYSVPISGARVHGAEVPVRNGAGLQRSLIAHKKTRRAEDGKARRQDFLIHIYANICEFRSTRKLKIAHFSEYSFGLKIALRH
jgi:hypothetical protein